MSGTMKKHEEERMGNYSLDDLPDDVLLEILSLLPLRDAAAASILSSRWRYLWRFARMSLNFSVDITTHSFEHCGDAIEYLIDGRGRYINWVNSVVKQHLGPVDSFRLCYSLHRRHRTCINKWIKFAMRSPSLQRFELDFSIPYITDKSPYNFFPLYFFNMENVGLKSLKVLSLKSMCVSGEDVDYFLSNAPVLERLEVHDSPKLAHIRVSGKSLALKHLGISKCRKLESVEICHVNIVSLDLRRTPSNFIFRNVHSLVELHVGLPWDRTQIRDFQKKFRNCLSQIKVLRMDDGVRHCKWSYVSYPQQSLPNVKQLHLRLSDCRHISGGGLSNLRLMLWTLPNLERLVLLVKTPDYSSRFEEMTLSRRGKPAKKPHSCLKEVEILDYNPKFGDMERVLYLINNSVALQKIVINCEYRHGSRELKSKQDLFEFEEFSRRHAMTQLKPQVPSTIEFVCR